HEMLMTHNHCIHKWEMSKYADDVIRKAERRLEGFCRTTLDPDKFLEYVEACSKEHDLPSNFYANMLTKPNDPSHWDRENTCRSAGDCGAKPMHRTQTDNWLADKLHRMFGKDVVIFFGDWSASHSRLHEPILGTGWYSTLERNGIKV
ncbi:hypothetical protein LPJ61_005482, partial [Coemansia biformis]